MLLRMSSLRQLTHYMQAPGGVQKHMADASASFEVECMWLQANALTQLKDYGRHTRISAAAESGELHRAMPVSF